MLRGNRYNQREIRGGRRPLLYGRWLRAWAGALRCLLRGGALSTRLLWTEDARAALLAAGFPALSAVPERLFSETAALFPGRFRLGAAVSEDELLAQIRRAEEHFSLRFDWDAFLAACERRDRLSRRLRALSEAIGRRAEPLLDTRSPSAALRGLLGKESQT